jgi:hypothetical protein
MKKEISCGELFVPETIACSTETLFYSFIGINDPEN